MRFNATWLSILPVFALSVACGETRSPTGLSAESARLEIGTTSVACVEQINLLIARTNDPDATPISGKFAESKDRPGLVAKLTRPI